MLNKLDYISQWADNAANLSLVIHLENENSALIIHLRDLIYCFHFAFMANFKYLNQFSRILYQNQISRTLQDLYFWISLA